MQEKSQFSESPSDSNSRAGSASLADTRAGIEREPGLQFAFRFGLLRVAGVAGIDEDRTDFCFEKLNRFSCRFRGPCDECVFGVLALESEPVDPRL